MTSDKLYPCWGLRVRVQGVFTGPGKRGRRTLQFQNVTLVNSGELVREHTWIPAEEFPYFMRIGDLVSFDAHVGSYERQSSMCDLRRLGLGFSACNKFWTESHGNPAQRWNPHANLEVAA